MAESPRTCMRLADWLVDARMTPHMPRPAITPPFAVPAHAVNKNMLQEGQCGSVWVTILTMPLTRDKMRHVSHTLSYTVSFEI